METVFALSTLQSPFCFSPTQTSSGTSKVSFFSLPRVRKLQRNAHFPPNFREAKNQTSRCRIQNPQIYGSPGKCLLFPSSSSQMTGDSDADWAGDVLDRKSITEEQEVVGDINCELPNFLHDLEKTYCSLLIEPYRMQHSSLTAVVGDAAALAKDGAAEQLSLSGQSEDNAIHGGSTEKENEGGDQKKDTECVDDEPMIEVLDKLIQIFMVDKPTPLDWRRLLAFSRTWGNLRPHFYRRCQVRADAEEDPGLKHQLLRFQRKLKEIDADVQRHNELIEVIRGKSPSEISAVVSRRRKDFTREFFGHLFTVAQSYLDDPNEQKALEKLANQCIVAIEVYETESESTETLQIAEFKFQDLINSTSVDAVRAKIQNMAKNNDLDPSVALMVSKAWTDTKETHIVKNEAKDIMFHMYKNAIGNLQMDVPKEVRILKYLLRIKDPGRRLPLLHDAFTPGEEVMIENMPVDLLYTTPQVMLALICSVLDAYNSGQTHSVIREARDLVDVKHIPKLEELKKLIRDNFM